MVNNDTNLQKQESAAVVAKPNHSERFTQMVMREYGSNAGIVEMTDFQRSLVQGYFIGIDRALQTADEERIRKGKQTPPVTWENVNLIDLARDVVHYSRMGLDMMQPNHLTAVPYINNKTQKYDVALRPGYGGIQYIAEKYALSKPTGVTTELVYSNDVFIPIKKSVNQPVEAYEFEIQNPFDRGEVVGGFGYIEYEDRANNKLVIMSRKDIEKRKPPYAAKEFWGNWFEEMCMKTLKRAVYGAKNIPLDPKKVDADWHYMKMRENQVAEIEANAEIAELGNGGIIDVVPVVQQMEVEKPFEADVNLSMHAPEAEETVDPLSAPDISEAERMPISSAGPDF